VIPNTPERLLYVRGQSTESEERDILVATVDVSEAREPDIDVILVV
jgi:plasmid stability protein